MSDATPSKTDRYGIKRPKVPAFARYEGTSVWRDNKRKVRVYQAFRAEQSKLQAAKTS